MLARQGHIQADNANGPPIVDDKVHGAGLRQIVVVRKTGSKFLALIVVAGNDGEWDSEAREEFPRFVVFSGRTLVNQVAADDDEIRAWRQAVQMKEGGREHTVRVDYALIENASGSRMWIRK